MFYYLNVDNKKEINDSIIAIGDFVILYYSDMCGHCIQLKPTWNKLCDSIKNKKDITIINVEENNIEYLPEKYKKNIQGYPTIIKYSRGKKREYEGNRELDDLKKFIMPIAMPTAMPRAKPTAKLTAKPIAKPKVRLAKIQ